jgi:hypothetical protein
MSHSKEPWTTERRGETCYVLSGDKIILTVKDGAIYGGQYRDAERLVACVNACRGIPTNMLESVAKGEAEMGWRDPKLKDGSA